MAKCLETFNRVYPKGALLRLRSGHVWPFQRSERRFVNPRLNLGHSQPFLDRCPARRPARLTMLRNGVVNSCEPLPRPDGIRPRQRRGTECGVLGPQRGQSRSRSYRSGPAPLRSGWRGAWCSGRRAGRWSSRDECAVQTRVREFRRSISRQGLGSDASRRVAERGLRAPRVILTRLELLSVPLRKDANNEFRLSAVHVAARMG